MVSNAKNLLRLTLRVQRLMDADILPPTEGKALLAEIEAMTWGQGTATIEEAVHSDDLLPDIAPVVISTARYDHS